MSESTPCTTCGNPLLPGPRFCGTCGATAADARDPGAAEPGTVSGTDEAEGVGTASGEPTTPTTAFGTGDPSAPPTTSAPPPPSHVAGVAPLAGPTGETPPPAWPPAQAPPPVGGTPTVAEQAVAAAGGGAAVGPSPAGPGGGAPGGGPPRTGPGGERPHWMPDPASESKSSRTGLFVLLGVAGGVLVTLVALVAVLSLGGDDEQVSSQDTTSTTAEPTTTEPPASSTSTTTSEATTTTAPSTTTTTAASAPPGGELEVGTCISEDLVSSSGPVDAFTPVPCSQPHRAELFAAFNLPPGPYPSNAERTTFTVERCQGSPFESYVGRDYASSQVYVTGVFPDEAGWNAGSRAIQCFAHERDGSPTTGTYQNSNR